MYFDTWSNWYVVMYHAFLLNRGGEINVASENKLLLVNYIFRIICKSETVKLIWKYPVYLVFSYYLSISLCLRIMYEVIFLIYIKTGTILLGTGNLLTKIWVSLIFGSTCMLSFIAITFLQSLNFFIKG